MWWRNVVYIRYKKKISLTPTIKQQLPVCGVLSALLQPLKTHYVQCIGSTEINYEGNRMSDALMKILGHTKAS